MGLNHSKQLKKYKDSDVYYTKPKNNIKKCLISNCRNTLQTHNYCKKHRCVIKKCFNKCSSNYTKQKICDNHFKIMKCIKCNYEIGNKIINKRRICDNCFNRDYNNNIHSVSSKTFDKANIHSASSNRHVVPSAPQASFNRHVIPSAPPISNNTSQPSILPPQYDDIIFYNNNEPPPYNETFPV